MSRGAADTSVCATVLLLLLVAPPAWGQVSLIQAIEATLARHPQLEVQRERVNFANARVKQAASPFDTVIDAEVQHSLTHTPLTGLQQLQAAQAGLTGDQSANFTTLGPGASKLLRDGIQFSSSLNLGRTTDNVAQTQGVNLSQFRFQVQIPLMRGRGREVVAAEETAARIEGDSAVYDLNFTAASLITDTATRYWELVAARQSLQVAQEAEERGRVLVANVRALIEGEKLPRAELQQVLANVASRTANRAAAEQRVIEATQALALAMGLPAEDLTRNLTATDPLPDGESAPLPAMSQPEILAWVQRALTRRADYLSARHRQGAFDVRRVAAADKLKPQLDFRISSGYSGLKEGRRPDRLLASPFTNVSGADVTGGISYTLPIGRRAAQSQLEQAISLDHQNRLGAEDLARTITSSVLAGVGAYTTAIVRVKEARASVDASQAALDGEREKLRLGVGSVVDLLTIEDRMTTARGVLVDAGLNFATLLARVRFATGTVIEPDRPAQTVKGEVFYRPPWEDNNP